MTRKQCLFIVPLMLCLVSCISAKGTLEVQKKLSFQDTKGRPLTINKGWPKALFTASFDNTIKMNVEDYKQTSATFKLSSDIDQFKTLQDYRTYLTSDEIGQPYEVDVQIKVNPTEGEEKENKENCTYTRFKEVCHEEWVTMNGRQRKVKFCRQVPEQKNGEQKVRYKWARVYRDFTLSFYEKNSLEKAATFSGQHTDRQKIYTYKGRCH